MGFRRPPLSLILQLLTLAATTTGVAQAEVLISEIAAKGSSICRGDEDYVELYNNGTIDVDLGKEGYVLYDNKGSQHKDAYAFLLGTVLLANEYLLLCTNQKIPADDDATATSNLPDPNSPQFGIASGDDTIILAKLQDTSNTVIEIGARMNGIAYETIASFVELPSETETQGYSLEKATYALNLQTGEYAYSSTATPGTANVFTPLKTWDEVAQEIKDQLAAQNSLGTPFFNMDNQGLPVPDGMEEVLKLYITMIPEDYQYTMQNASYELYRPFQSISVKSTNGTLLASVENGPGEIRPKGQTTLYFSKCLGTITMPFQVKFENGQHLYGMEKFYLRNHLKDNSYMRDFAYNRMLARFGLPHLRTRSVVVFINNEKHGLYSMMEAADQDYVFARNFPSYDPQDHALYKFTNLANHCGAYSQDMIANAIARLEETSTPSYAFERGDHRSRAPELGVFELDQCIDEYFEDVETRDKEDTVLAWLQHDKECGKMIVETGLMDRDLGTSDWDNKMEDFVDKHLGAQQCDPGCTNSDLVNDIDVDNFLKTYAFYAVTLNSDSPLVKGHNYYLAQSGDGKGWKLLAYDFNYPSSTVCNEDICNKRLVHWSIIRPTCESLESNKLVGPLLTKPDLQDKYLGYIEDFLETIYANQTFVDQLTMHVQALREHAVDDFWSTWGAYIDLEQSPDAADWNTAGQFPLLPTMKARTADVRSQLQAIADGTIARGPVVGEQDNEPWETCADWRLPEVDTSSCPMGCKYDGCHISGWVVESFCDEATGTCLHGDYDEQCYLIWEGDQYPGMASRPDGRATFCRFAKGFPVAASECPEYAGPVISAGVSNLGSYRYWYLAIICLISPTVLMFV